MLQRLSISNYAIIDVLDIEFSDKLNIITGETGAGKSIIMGALGLILGDRADSTVLVNKQKKSIIEAVFIIDKQKDTKELLEDLDVDIADDLTVRREIAVNGKSRAFINDTPVTLSQLQQLSALLVDLHQQFDTLQLSESTFQMQVLDALATNAELLTEYRKNYRAWQATEKELNQLKFQKQQFEKEADYNRFQFDELNEANFIENELEQAEAELKLLNSGEAIKATLDKLYYELEEGEQPLVQQLKILVNQLIPFQDYHPEIRAIVERLQATQIELKDISGEVAHIGNAINYDAERISHLNERLSIGYRLQKKHAVKSTAELLEIKENLGRKLTGILDLDDQITALEKKSDGYYKQAAALAKKLTSGRKEASGQLEQQVNKLLSRVGMPNAKLKVGMATAQFNHFGADEIEFLFDANKSGQFQSIGKVASGGELSRLMLCIKSLVAESVNLPTMIFDEIDTGISGEAARQVAMIMKNLAAKRQVICITHQPQIAGKADAHYFVYKEIVKDIVKTGIRILSAEERITAIAKMLSGERPTAAAMENAREMLSN